MQYIAIRTDSSKELYHYGVKGMKWGVVRGPQEVKTQILNKREVKAQKFDKLASEAKTDKTRKMYEREAERARTGKLSRRQRQLIVGASIVAAYATYKFVDSGEAHRLISNGKALLEGKSGAAKWAMDESLANKNLSPDEVFSKVVSRINPDYGKLGTTNNCRRCTFAYVQSRKGYDVVATKSIGATGQSNIELYNATTNGSKIRGGSLGVYNAIFSKNDKYDGFKTFLDQELKDLYVPIDIKDEGTSFLGPARTGKTISKSIFSSLSKMPNNSCGEINMRWNVGGGHSMAWEIINGRPVVFDTQTKKMYDTPEKLIDIANRIKDVDYSRLDNINLDPTIIGRWLTNAKR